MKTIIRMHFGSTVYGTSTPESDTDYKSVAIPPTRDIILQKAFRSVSNSTGDDQSKNTKDDIDDDAFSVHYYFKMLLDANTTVLDMLFTPEKFWISKSHEWDEIIKKKSIFLNKDVSSYAGYCQTQAAKYSLKGSNLAAFELVYKFFDKFPYHQKVSTVLNEFETEILAVSKMETIYHDKGESIIKIVDILHKVTKVSEFYIQVGPKTKVPINASCGLAADVYKEQSSKYGARAKLAQSNQGCDWKALSHALRVCRQAEELLLTGHMTFPLQDHNVMKVKKGEIPFVQVSEMIVEGLDRVNAAKEKSKLPEKPDFKAAESLLYDIYEEFVFRELNFDRR